MRADLELLQHAVVRSHGFFRRDLMLDDQPQEFDERQLAFGGVDLAAVQGGSGAVFLGLGNSLNAS